MKQLLNSAFVGYKKILQMSVGVIHRGWITPFSICRVLDILRKPNSILLIIIVFFAFATAISSEVWP